MRSAKLTTLGTKVFLFYIALSLSTFTSSAQENSPLSRYGLGDIVPGQNMVTRAMGGISAGFVDSVNLLFHAGSMNLNNPAALGSLAAVGNSPQKFIFDIGGEIDVRTLRSNISPLKYRATNVVINYLQMGFPITPERMQAKGNNWVVALGLKPQTRVNYRVIADSRVPGVDSLAALYEGEGGLNLANVSTGIRIKNFSFGITSGYLFGNRTTSTKIGFVNDTVAYKESNSESQARFGGIFLGAGIQYKIKIDSTSLLRIGVNAEFSRRLDGKRDDLNQTFFYDNNGEVVQIDSVSRINDIKGKVVTPANYTVGMVYQNENWMFGADVNLRQWKDYSFFGVTDPVKNTVTVHAGAQYLPIRSGQTFSYWRFVRYRLGAYFGKDYVSVGGENRNEYGVTFGAGLPLTDIRNSRSAFYNSVVFNVGGEVNRRGGKDNVSFRENTFRIHAGVAISTNWFVKRKYD